MMPMTSCAQGFANGDLAWGIELKFALMYFPSIFCLIDAWKIHPVAAETRDQQLIVRLIERLIASESLGEAAERGKGFAESSDARRSAHPTPPQLKR
jgi:hypothetical protein